VGNPFLQFGGTNGDPFFAKAEAKGPRNCLRPSSSDTCLLPGLTAFKSTFGRSLVMYSMMSPLPRSEAADSKAEANSAERCIPAWQKTSTSYPFRPEWPDTAEASLSMQSSDQPLEREAAAEPLGVDAEAEALRIPESTGKW